MKALSTNKSKNIKSNMLQVILIQAWYRSSYFKL